MTDLDATFQRAPLLFERVTFGVAMDAQVQRKLCNDPN
jgi:hypothetical protein